MTPRTVHSFSELAQAVPLLEHHNPRCRELDLRHPQPHPANTNKTPSLRSVVIYTRTSMHIMTVYIIINYDVDDTCTVEEEVKAAPKKR